MSCDASIGVRIRGLFVAGAAVLFTACPAAAQTGSDVSVTASTAYDSNPFLAFGNDTETASFRLELAPSVYRSDGISSLKVSGRVEHVEYMRRYDSTQNLSANVAASHRISERLDATANFSISSSVSTTDFVGPIGVGDEVGSDDLPLPIDNDITLLGDRQRRNQAAADATLRYTPSEFDEIRWSSSARANRYGAARLQDSDYASQRLAYSRRINDGFMIGGLVDASISNFRDTRVGDARTLSPQLSVSALLGARLQASGSFGVAFTRTNLAVGRDTSMVRARCCLRQSAAYESRPRRAPPIPCACQSAKPCSWAEAIRWHPRRLRVPGVISKAFAAMPATSDCSTSGRVCLQVLVIPTHPTISARAARIFRARWE